jgi:hypothetical protein
LLGPLDEPLPRDHRCTGRRTHNKALWQVGTKEVGAPINKLLDKPSHLGGSGCGGTVM